MSRLTMGSLFDGIGGFPLAAIRSGITPVWASEIEAFPIEVTKLRFPDMVHVGDITKLHGAELPPVDIICGGSPCQDYAEEIVIPKSLHRVLYDWLSCFVLNNTNFPRSPIDTVKCEPYHVAHRRRAFMKRSVDNRG